MGKEKGEFRSTLLSEEDELVVAKPRNKYGLCGWRCVVCNTCYPYSSKIGRCKLCGAWKYEGIEWSCPSRSSSSE